MRHAWHEPKKAKTRCDLWVLVFFLISQQHMQRLRHHYIFHQSQTWTSAVNIHSKPNEGPQAVRGSPVRTFASQRADGYTPSTCHTHTHTLTSRLDDGLNSLKFTANVWPSVWCVRCSTLHGLGEDRSSARSLNILQPCQFNEKLSQQTRERLHTEKMLSWKEQLARSIEMLLLVL